MSQEIVAVVITNPEQPVKAVTVPEAQTVTAVELPSSEVIEIRAVTVPETATVQGVAVPADQLVAYARLTEVGPQGISGYSGFSGSGGGGGSLLSNAIARVDPSGSDITGTIGDLSKPFLTVQGAITAIEGAGTTDPIIDIGNNKFQGTVTTSLSQIRFEGCADEARSGGDYFSKVCAFLVLTSTGGISVELCGCEVDNITTSTALGTLTITLEHGGIAGFNGAISAVGAININGDGATASAVLDSVSSSGNGTIHLKNVYVDVIDSGTSNVIAERGAIIRNINSANNVSLSDARITNNNNAGGTTSYSDELLIGSAPGGTTGQVQAKVSNADFDVTWINPPASGYSGYSGSGLSGYSGFSGVGLSGYSGFSSTSGYSGFCGLSGYSGFSGKSGYSGFCGLSGYSGFCGLSGYSGFSSTSGYSGFCGLSGYSGFSGSGISGYSGYSGAGLSGFSGYSGFCGLSGYSGFCGLSGYSGFCGLSGYSGFCGTGTSGFSGYSGSPAQQSGYSGFCGLSGYSGFCGLSGYSGFCGLSGYSGFCGLSGYSGYSGSGVSGYSGFSAASPGASGYSGFCGLSGYSGFCGLSGYSGFCGLSGYSGFCGLSGYSGFCGLSGYSGFCGLSGYSGYSSAVAGTSGFSGYSGVPLVKTGVATSPTATQTDTITHGLGKTPVIIRLYGIGTFTSNAAATPTTCCVGVWSSSGNRCIFQAYNTAAITTTQASAVSSVFSIRLDTGANSFITGVVQNVGATTFDIAWTETGTASAQNYMWEAT